MSDSSEDDTPLDLQEDDETDDEQPRKRRRTMKTLRGRGVGFVQSAQQNDDEDDVDDSRPSFGGFRSAFNIGDYKEDSPAEDEFLQPSPPPVIRPSAFSDTGMGAKSSFAARQMAKMGYVEGQGLGAKGTGIAAPIQAVGTTGRSGLGMTSAAAHPKKTIDKKKPQTRIPGSRTPAVTARPKTKYRTIADIEAQGLAVPAALKSIIIDATGTETKSVSSPAGFSTPSRTASPDREISKIATRAKLGLEAYAASWAVEQQSRDNLVAEEAAIAKEMEILEQEIARQRSLIASLEVASLVEDDDAPNSTELSRVTQRLKDLRASWSDELELSDAASAILEPIIRREVVEWDPGATPDLLAQALQDIKPILEPQSSYRQNNNTAFQSILMQHWLPRVREYFNYRWDVYDSERAVRFLTSWRPLLSPWLLCKVIDTLVLPKLGTALQAFRKASTRKSKVNDIPPLAVWVPEWLALLSLDEFASSSLADLKSLVKDALDSKSWEDWKSFFGKERRSRPQPALVPEALPIPPALDTPDVSFRDMVEDWAMESGLLFQSLRISNTRGQPLYRLRPEDSKSPGVVVYLQDDVVFDQDELPYGLDEKLVQRAGSK